MKEMIIVSGRQFLYSDGANREKITAKKAEQIFREWKAAGRTVTRKYGMAGKVTWIWPV